MQYWINHNGVQSGPVELEALKDMGLTSAAYVWREGMADWVKITQMPELQGMYEMVAQPQAAAPQPAGAAAPQQPQVVTGDPIGGQPQYGPVQPSEPCPPTNMVWAVLATIFCCIPLGIVGIVYANKVSKCYLAGDIEGAKRASETGAWWCIAAITIGVIWRPLMFCMSGGA
ncbi:MAG: CD225/dispanin family protein [Muribaculaceae bacterium]|nr:CD225/dispanin family protein [Muribaculaceae bacterium]